VSEEKRSRYFITNHQNQPLELHLATGVIVLGAREEVEVRKEDLAAPQLGTLRHNRLITTRVAEEDPPADAPESKRRVKRK
jgi:hypothetical protein